MPHWQYDEFILFILLSRGVENQLFLLCGQACEELFWRHHIKCVRQVKRDNYAALRSVLFQIFSQGLSFPSWMKEKDIVKVRPHTGAWGNVILTGTAVRMAGLPWAALCPETEGHFKGRTLSISERPSYLVSLVFNAIFSQEGHLLSISKVVY